MTRLLRRAHVVAASLVGAVVVVVGYASGFGLRPVTAAPVRLDPMLLVAGFVAAIAVLCLLLISARPQP